MTSKADGSGAAMAGPNPDEPLFPILPATKTLTTRSMSIAAGFRPCPLRCALHASRQLFRRFGFSHVLLIGCGDSASNATGPTRERQVEVALLQGAHVASNGR
jgi:hypothetical protein